MDALLVEKKLPDPLRGKNSKKIIKKKGKDISFELKTKLFLLNFMKSNIDKKNIE